MKSKLLLLLALGPIFHQFAGFSQDTIITAPEKTEEGLKIFGELITDQRFKLQDHNDWIWNENRLSLKLDQKIRNNSRFYSEVWLRNFGIPQISHSSNLYNKGILEPYDIEIREAWLQLNGFLSNKLDLTVGRQRIAWGTADKLNPSDNLNPSDFEDILDFGRHRASDAIRLDFYLNNDFSIQGVYLPFFRPANLPAGIYANTLMAAPELPDGLVLNDFSDTIVMPLSNLAENSGAGLKFKGFFKGIDFSFSYFWGYDGLPYASFNTLSPAGFSGETDLRTQLSYYRTHIFGADLAGSLAGIGIWAEAALFKPNRDVVMTSDLSALYAQPPLSVILDSTLLQKSNPWLKFVLGADYHFKDGSYLNLQYMHGFVHERGIAGLNDYFFIRFEMKFFGEKLKISPLSGGFAIDDWHAIKENYAIAYMPEINYKINENTEIMLSAVILDGKGKNLFAGLKNTDSFICRFKYSF